jgi:hypothetical protein
VGVRVIVVVVFTSFTVCETPAEAPVLKFVLPL